MFKRIPSLLAEGVGGGVCQYVIGCLSTSSKGEKDGYTAYQINPENNMDWIKLSMQKSLIKTQIDDLKGNTITLSTCLTGNSDDKGCVVMAKEIK